ncbi:MAG: hypothetical protein AMXMBFR13_46660 [Phycisphaerae bacterium]
MKSPFPGMDPYLERHWPDIHTSLVGSAREALNQGLPPDLVARAEERVAIESGEDEPARVVPDVRVLEMVEQFRGPTQVGGLVIDAPYRLVHMVEPLTERYIEIIESSGNRLITVIEVLSPANKVGSGLEAFRNKRAQLLEGGVHVVEIDLVRAGDWRALLRPYAYPRKAVSTYRATIRLADEPGVVYLYPIPLRERLPSLPIPLRPGDPRVELDLQPLVASAYSHGRYGTTLDYRQSCEPPMSAEESAWADELLRSVGKK